MQLATFKIGTKEFVVLPRQRFDQLTRAEQDNMDAVVARKGDKLYRTGKAKTVSHAALKRKLGL